MNGPLVENEMRELGLDESAVIHGRAQKKAAKQVRADALTRTSRQDGTDFIV